jgi:hypothetical protein
MGNKRKKYSADFKAKISLGGHPQRGDYRWPGPRPRQHLFRETVVDGQASIFVPACF